MIKRLFQSVAVGFAIPTVGLILSGLLLPYTDPAKKPSALAEFAGRVVVETLDWPTRFLRSSNLDCPNADSIADKLKCAGFSIGIAEAVYTSVTFMGLWLVDKKKTQSAYN